MKTTVNTAPAFLHDDEWGCIIDRPIHDLLETRWYDTTSELTGPRFNEWIEMFAGRLEQSGRSHVLVDATSFKMDPAQVDTEWRDSKIIPRYVRAGVAKFAFHMPRGMPLIGSPPRPEGPATFPTAYFGSRRDALDWLNGAER